MITALLASENIVTMEKRSGYNDVPYARIDLMNSVSTISFFSLKVKGTLMQI